MVRTLAVIFSPTWPSPRVAARTNSPFSYRILTAKPSSLGSQLKSNVAESFSLSFKRFSKASSDSSSKALSSDSIGTSWVTCSKADNAAPPTF